MWFERLYFLSVSAGLIGSYLGLQRLPEILAAARAQAEAQKGAAVPDVTAIAQTGVYASIVISLVVSAALWFFICRRPNVVAKWIEVALFGFATLGAIFVIKNIIAPDAAAAAAADPFGGGVNLFAYALQGAAVFMLFQRDAITWFTNRGDE